MRTENPADLKVIYEDNHIIAVNKQPSDIVQGDKTGDAPLSDIVKEYIAKKYNKPGEVFLGTVHRLDRPVSGIVLYARTSKALSRLNEMFRDRKVTKIYWACVRKPVAKLSGTLIHYLIKDNEKNKSKAYENPVKDAKKSELNYKVISETDHYHLLEVLPQTGRHHQIRVQLAAMGSPIKGDVKYGFTRGNGDGSIHLHARSITFIHPVQRVEVTLVADPPEDPLWTTFLNNIPGEMDV